MITPWGLSRVFMPATKLQTSGTWASTLLPRIRSAWVPSRTISAAISWPKNFTSVGMPFLVASLATFTAGSMPSTGTLLFHEILEQIAVIAGQFHHQAVVAQLEALDHQLGVGLGMGQPTVGIGGEIGVLGEDMFRG